MKKSRFSEEQIINILWEADGGQAVQVVCARHNVSTATFYSWKKKYGGMDVNEARRLRALEEENNRLKRVQRVRRMEGLQVTKRQRRMRRLGESTA